MADAIIGWNYMTVLYNAYVKSAGGVTIGKHRFRSGSVISAMARIGTFGEFAQRRAGGG